MSLAFDTAAAPPIGHNNPPAAALADMLAERHATILAEVDVVADRANSLPKKVENDIHLGRVGDVVKAARALARKLDDARKGEVDPHLAAQRETNAFFAVATDRLKKIGDVLGQRATDYQVAKEAEERRLHMEEARKAREAEDRAREAAQRAAEANRPAQVAKHEDKAELAALKATEAESAAQATAADLTRTRSSNGTVSTTKTIWDFEITDFAVVPLEALRPYLPRADIEKAIRSAVRMGTREMVGVRIYQSKTAAFR